MKVINYIGYPIDWAPGGHGDQIRNSIKALRKFDIEISWLHNEEQDIRKQYDIIHFWSTPPKLIIDLAINRGLKCVLSTMLPSSRNNKISYYINKFTLKVISSIKIHPRISSAFENVYKKVDALIVLNDIERKHFSKIWEVDFNKIFVIPNGIDDIFFNNDIEPEYFDGLVMVGYICDIKNSLEVAKICRKNKIKIKFIGNFRLSNQEYINNFLNEIDNNYTFWLDHLPKSSLIAHIKGANGLILPSKYEAQPLVVFEATALNKPVLLTDLPTLRNTYRDFKNITYCHPSNKKILEKEIIDFNNYVRNNNLINTIVQNKILSWDNVGEMIYQVYRKILLK